MPRIEPDMSEAVKYVTVPAGEYEVSVESVEGPLWPGQASEEDPYKANGKRAYPMIRLSFTITEDGDYKGDRLGSSMFLSTAGPYAGYLVDALQALLPAYTEGEAFDTNELVGKAATAVITEGTYQGDKTNNVKRLK